VDALSAEVNKSTRALGNALASFSKKMDESVESLKSRMEEIAEEVFRADAISLENTLRTIVSGVVSERLVYYTRLHFWKYECNTAFADSVLLKFTQI